MQHAQAVAEIPLAGLPSLCGSAGCRADSPPAPLTPSSALSCNGPCFTTARVPGTGSGSCSCSVTLALQQSTAANHNRSSTSDNFSLTPSTARQTSNAKDTKSKVVTGGVDPAKRLAIIRNIEDYKKWIDKSNLQHSDQVVEAEYMSLLSAVCDTATTRSPDHSKQPHSPLGASTERPASRLRTRRCITVQSNGSLPPHASVSTSHSSPLADVRRYNDAESPSLSDSRPAKRIRLPPVSTPRRQQINIAIPAVTTLASMGEACHSELPTEGTGGSVTSQSLFKLPGHYIHHKVHRDYSSGLELSDGTKVHYQFAFQDREFLDRVNKNYGGRRGASNFITKWDLDIPNDHDHYSTLYPKNLLGSCNVCSDPHREAITDEEFVFLMDTFEKLSFKNGCNSVPFEQALFCFRDVLGFLHVRSQVVREVYNHWQARMRELGRPLARQFWPSTSSRDASPQAVFRSRQREKMILRRPKKNVGEAQKKIECLLEDFQRVEKLLKRTLQRDEKKLALTEMNALLFDQQRNEITDATYRSPVWEQARNVVLSPSERESASHRKSRHIDNRCYLQTAPQAPNVGKPPNPGNTAQVSQTSGEGTTGGDSAHNCSCGEELCIGGTYGSEMAGKNNATAATAAPVVEGENLGRRNGLSRVSSGKLTKHKSITTSCANHGDTNSIENEATMSSSSSGLSSDEEADDTSNRFNPLENIIYSDGLLYVGGRKGWHPLSADCRYRVERRPRLRRFRPFNSSTTLHPNAPSSLPPPPPLPHSLPPFARHYSTFSSSSENATPAALLLRKGPVRQSSSAVATNQVSPPESSSAASADKYQDPPQQSNNSYGVSICSKGSVDDSSLVKLQLCQGRQASTESELNVASNSYYSGSDTPNSVSCRHKQSLVKESSINSLNPSIVNSVPFRDSCCNLPAHKAGASIPIKEVGNMESFTSQIVNPSSVYPLKCRMVRRKGRCGRIWIDRHLTLYCAVSSRLMAPALPTDSDITEHNETAAVCCNIAPQLSHPKPSGLEVEEPRDSSRMAQSSLLSGKPSVACGVTSPDFGHSACDKTKWDPPTFQKNSSSAVKEIPSLGVYLHPFSQDSLQFEPAFSHPTKYDSRDNSGGFDLLSLSRYRHRQINFLDALNTLSLSRPERKASVSVKSQVSSGGSLKDGKEKDRAKVNPFPQFASDYTLRASLRSIQRDFSHSIPGKIRSGQNITKF